MDRIQKKHVYWRRISAGMHERRVLQANMATKRKFLCTRGRFAQKSFFSRVKSGTGGTTSVDLKKGRPIIELTAIMVGI
jgi:hypothetical protein